MGGLWIWLICAGVPPLFGLWAQMRVKSTFNRYSQVPTRMRPVAGNLTDHYDPRSRTLNLSESVGQAATVTTPGVAAHGAGHALLPVRAAALPYVAGFVASLGQLIYSFLISRR